MARPILEVVGVSKRYCRDLRRSLRYGIADVARQLMPWRGSRTGLRRDEFLALDNVSFTLGAGEALAVVGHNGAGKSTLLRIIAGLTPPDAGEVRVAGRVQSVIELGSGFNPLLSGRENAHLILSWQTTGRARRDDLVAAAGKFAELGTLFDAPLQSYSTGMRARLAFALATQVPSDLLLLDEVLAVGDQAFQRKCLAHIQSYLNEGGALLFVSHNALQIQTVCRRGLLLDRGQAVFAGSAVEALDRMFDAETAAVAAVADSVDPALPSFEQVTVGSPDGAAVRTGGPLEVRVEYDLPEPVIALAMVSIWTRDLSVCVSLFVEDAASRCPAGHGSRTCVVPALPLVAGRYAVRAALVDPETNFAYAMHGYADAATPFEVAGDGDRSTMLRRDAGQLVMIDGSWREGSAQSIRPDKR